MRAKLHEYHGQLYTIRQLAELSGHSEDLLRKRFYMGWSADMAVEEPSDRNASVRVPEIYSGKDLLVEFRKPIFSVFPEMQPQLRKTYYAYHAHPIIHVSGKGAKEYFIIVLENQKKLIVYPGEFEIIGVAETENIEQLSYPKQDASANSQT